jgi:cobalt-precorrin 5A hydrolase
MIAIGIGANSQAGERDFAAALDEALAQFAPDAVATLEHAPFADRVRDGAQRKSLRYHSVTLESLRQRGDDCFTRSERALSLYGVGSMAEAAALAAAGSGSRLVMPRRIVGHVTIAVAQSGDVERRQ